MKNDSQTFFQIEELKKALPNNYNDFDSVLEYQYETLKSGNKSVSYTEALRNLMGVYPADFINFLLNDKKEKGTFIVFDESFKEPEDNTLWKDEFSLPAQLANYEWRYTNKSAEQIVKYICQYNKIGCLGTPSIVLKLVEIDKANKETILFDINKLLIKKIKAKCLKIQGIDCIDYDVIDEVPSDYKDYFDIISVNPPWYYDYYELFIFRALQMLKKSNKEILVPLFPLLSKHNAIKETIQLFNFLENLGCNKIESLGFVEFEMPLFEKNALEEKGIPIPLSHWRKAELVKLSFSSTQTFEKNIIVNIGDHIKWESKLTESNTLFLFNEKCFDDTNTNCVFKKERINDISRKSIDRKRIILWNVNNNEVILKLE